MKLELYGTYCKIKKNFAVFKINGIEANINDFGLRIIETCGDKSSNGFIVGSFTKEKGEKYKINHREYIQLAEKIEQIMTD